MVRHHMAEEHYFLENGRNWDGKKKSKNPGLKVLPKGGRGTQRLVIMEQWEERLYSSLLLTFGFNTFLLKNRAVVVRKDLG